MTKTGELIAVAPCRFKEAMRLIDAAKTYLKTQGIDQWQDGYPDEAIILQDIHAGRAMFFITDPDEAPAAYLTASIGDEPAYDRIDGAWLMPGSRYGVVHRLAVDPSRRGQGIGSRALEAAEKRLMDMGAESFRIDTDVQNSIMRHLLLKLGFSLCGGIRFQNTDKLGYEKPLCGHGVPPQK